MTTRFKKILLIQPMHEKLKKSARTSINFPWGLAAMASFYQKANFEVEILDGQAKQLAKEELLPEIDKRDFDIVGISAFSTQYPAVRLFADHIKQSRQVPILVGGPLAHYQAEMTLRTTQADVCVIGEGEIAGIETLEQWDNLEGVKGIAFKRDGQVVFSAPQDRFVNLDELPMPDFGLFDMQRYLRQRNAYAAKENKDIRAITVITSRGCPFSCNFCSKSSRHFRSMSPKKIYEMLAELKSRFQIEEVSFGDELFLSSKSKFRELLPSLKSLNIPWGGQARVNLVDREFLEMVKEAGCIGLGYGIESGSQKILDNMNKKTTVAQIESAMQNTIELNIPIKVQLIFGYPGEDDSTVQETIELFKRVDHPGRRFTVITPIPGSQIYDDCLAQGLIPDEPAYLGALEKGFGMGTVHINFTQWPDDEIYPRKRAVEEAIRRNYYSKNIFRRIKYFFRYTIRRKAGGFKLRT